MPLAIRSIFKTVAIAHSEQSEESELNCEQMILLDQHDAATRLKLADARHLF